jgi:branched-subunit amino acid ABC-type transport system permease component
VPAEPDAGAGAVVKEYLPFLITGVTAGSLYGLAASGLVLTYKTSGLFNFAHGAIAAAAAFAFYDLHQLHGLNWPAALLISVAVVGAGAGWLIELLARGLAEARPVLKIVATIGLSLVIQGLINLRYGFNTRGSPSFLPAGGVRVSGVLVENQQIFGTVVAAVMTAGLYLLLRRSPLGASMRAVVDDPLLLDLAGTSAVRVRRAAWIIGSMFAALTGILIAPSLGLDATLLSLLVVQAFGAAAIGRFSSLPGAYLGGIAIGVAAALLTKEVASSPALSGLPSSLPFIVLFVGLLLFPPARQLLAAQKVGGSRAARTGPSAPRYRKLTAGLVLGAAALVPQLAGSRLSAYTNALVFVPLFLGLALLVWASGQVSLCHAAFMAIGASTFGHLAGNSGVPWFVALILAGLAVVPLGALVAIPAIRLSGLYLGLATFGFGILVERVAFGNRMMFGPIGLIRAPRPSIAQGDHAFYYVTLAVAVGACGLVIALVKTRLGRLLRALGDAPVALATSGVGINATRVLAFCLAAFLAGVSGALAISLFGQASGRGFSSVNSMIWLAVLVLCGTAVIRSALTGAVVLALLPAYLPTALIKYQPLLFGTAAVIAAIGYEAFAGWRMPVTNRAAKSPVRARRGAGAPHGAPFPAVTA